MITWTALLGKVFDFAAEEVSNKLKKHPDKKEMACEVFTRLYFDISKLERLTEVICEAAIDATKDDEGAILWCRIQNLEKDLERLTRDFFETGMLLSDVLEIFDPEA